MQREWTFSVFFINIALFWVLLWFCYRNSLVSKIHDEPKTRLKQTTYHLPVGMPKPPRMRHQEDPELHKKPSKWSEHRGFPHLCGCYSSINPCCVMLLQILPNARPWSGSWRPSSLKSLRKSCSAATLVGSVSGGFRWFPENVSGGKGSFQGARNGLGISATCSDEADIPKCRRPAFDGEEENNNPPLNKHPCS